MICYLFFNSIALYFRYCSVGNIYSNNLQLVNRIIYHKNRKINVILWTNSDSETKIITRAKVLVRFYHKENCRHLTPHNNYTPYHTTQWLHSKSHDHALLLTYNDYTPYYTKKCLHTKDLGHSSLYHRVWVWWVSWRVVNSSEIVARVELIIESIKMRI